MSERPDFVMVGGQSDGMVYLLASETLTEVELRMERDRFEVRYGWPSSWGPQRHFVTAEMRDYVMVIGRDYAEAFRTLFEEWSPEPERREIEGLRAVTARARNVAYHELGIEPPPAIGSQRAIEP